jgi:hypothetical protein
MGVMRVKQSGRKKHWLVIWADNIDQIRHATASTEQGAIKDAFGLVRDDLSAIQLTLYELRTAKRRAGKIAELIQLHHKKYNKWLEAVDGKRDPEQWDKLAGVVIKLRNKIFDDHQAGVLGA